MSRHRVRWAALGLVGTLGCASWFARAPDDWRARLSSAPPAPASHNLPLPPNELERVMRQKMEIRSAKGAGSGIMGAMRIEAYYPKSHRTLELKWKAAPDGGDGWNNTPRREIAAYQVQKW